MTIPINKYNVVAVNKIVNEISKTKQNVLLCGNVGSGKSTVLEALKKENEDIKRPVIDATVGGEECPFISDDEVHNIYYACVTIKKMLRYIMSQHYKIYFANFKMFEVVIDKILWDIRRMYMVNNYNVPLAFTADSLLENFMENLTRVFDFQQITLIIDNFDKTAFRFQRFMYYTFKKYLRLIVTVSDEEVIKSPSKRKILAQDNKIIDVNYSLNVKDVKYILFSHLNNLNKKNYCDLTEIELSDELIARMIEITNGNIEQMLRAVNNLYRTKDFLNIDTAENYIIHYLYSELINREFLYSFENFQGKLYI